ncbi:hypothetical protein KM295_13020 [Natronomonas sp. F2-12]|uniref:Uncharacterized protein n=1 Tax=Natronomonas aquatica TaxID=2841590 RepID=A0A9R1D5H8_9EURY|nr:hypothetical protein [Natronomonas aquatica]
MTRIQQVLFELETAYLGHPYYVTGNALYQALAQRVDERMRRALCVSHGVFLPKTYGTPPAWYSQSSLGKVGVSLPPVESYDDLFLLRDAAQRWLKSSWPRDAQNAHPVQSHGGRLAFDPVTWFGRPPEMQTSKRSVRWFVQCYLHTMSGTHGESLLPVADETLDRLQAGGARNYGFGRLSLVDSQVIELDELAYDRVTAADDHVLELVSPFVVASEFPNADEQSVPWWWDTSRPRASPADGHGDCRASAASRAGLRRRTERLVDDDEVYELATIDHGQIVGYDGSRPVETAKNGVLRVGTHSRFGFGEIRVRPVSDDRVPERSPEFAGGEV